MSERLHASRLAPLGAFTTAPFSSITDSQDAIYANIGRPTLDPEHRRAMESLYRGQRTAKGYIDSAKRCLG